MLQSLGGATLTVKARDGSRRAPDRRSAGSVHAVDENGRGGVMSRASVEIGIGPVAPEQVVAVARRTPP